MVGVIGALGSANRYINFSVWLIRVYARKSDQPIIVSLIVWKKLNIQISTLLLPYWFSVGGNNYGLWSLIWWRVWNFSVVSQSSNCLMASGNYVRITWKRSWARSHVTSRRNINMLFTFVNISFGLLINRVKVSILCIMLGIDLILAL